MIQVKGSFDSLFLVGAYRIELQNLISVVVKTPHLFPALDFGNQYPQDIQRNNLSTFSYLEQYLRIFFYFLICQRESYKELIYFVINALRLLAENMKTSDEKEYL